MRANHPRWLARIVLLSIVSLVTALPGPWSRAAENAPEIEITTAHAAALEAYVEAWNTGDLNRLTDVVAPGFERHAGPAERCRSLADLEELIHATRAVYENLRITLDDRVIEGDRGAFRGSFYGVHQQVNGVIEFPLMGMLRFADGRIAEEWVLGDNFMPLVNLGHELVPPGFEAILPTGERLTAEDLEASVRPKEDLEAALAFASANLEAPEGETEHEALLRAYVDAWSTGEVGGLASVVTEGFTRHGGYGKAGSRAELERLITGYHRFYRDPHVEVHDQFAGAEKGAMRWRFRGGYGETSFEIDGTNYSILRFEDGKIAEEWVLGNVSDFWTSMGYRILPPGTEMIPPPVQDPPGALVPEYPELDTAALEAFAETARARVGGDAGELEIGARVASRLTLDSEPIGTLAPGSSVVLAIGPGAHTLSASSLGGSVFFRETVEVEGGKRASVELEIPARVILHSRNRTLEDLTTGLMWPLTDNGDHITQGAARDYCEASEHGGHTDWRLPSIYELETLYDPKATSKRFRTLDGVILTGCCPWTLSPQGDFHWTLLFYNGQRYVKYRTIGKASRALCVRYAGGRS